MKKTGIYIHIPFCVKKCAYCDFVSFDSVNCKREYFDALYKEISLRKMMLKNCECDTVFIGGGTPSSVDAEYISEILKMLPLSSFAEITLEANPGTLTEKKLEIYKKSGVNRISLGVQSLNDAELEKIGRIHSSDEVFKSVEMIKKLGFLNFNLDLMFGLPGQTLKSFENTLKSAVFLNPLHISAYSLIVEENTPIAKLSESEFPDEETEREMYNLAKKVLSENGYRQYEISNYAKEGMECRHNIKYWKLENYIGLGLNSHSFFENSRFFNTSDMKKYISMLENNELPLESYQAETPEELIKDYAITGFRLTEGIDINNVKKRLGIDFYNYFKPVLDKYISLHLIEKTDKGFRLSEKGIEVSNYILSDFV
ncbi:MAG: radical SAM family heme chaperone HemW [Clostridia bacterium]|nr:radical SAM family heme chaperone HemW [Clostridia bacterium]